MKQSTDLRLSLYETERAVEVQIERAGKPSLSFVNDMPPAVRVIGFKQPRISRERLLEFAEREADYFPEGKAGAIQSFITSQERAVYNYATDLRKIMRKMLMATEAAKAAKSVLSEVTQA